MYGYVDRENVEVNKMNQGHQRVVVVMLTGPMETWELLPARQGHLSPKVLSWQRTQKTLPGVLPWQEKR